MSLLERVNNLEFRDFLENNDYNRETVRKVYIIIFIIYVIIGISSLAA